MSLRMTRRYEISTTMKKYILLVTVENTLFYSWVHVEAFLESRHRAIKKYAKTI
jgi:hypothetical protein